MANLETLELRISANAEAATRGLGSLISSLGNLSDAIVKPYSDLRDLNAEIKKLKDAGKIKISVDATAAVKQAKTAAKKVKDAVVDMSQNNGRGGDSIHLPDPAKDAEWNRQLKENTAAYMAQREAIKKATIAARERMATEKAAAAEAAKTRMQDAMSLVNNADAVTLAKARYEEMAKAYFMNASAGKYNNQQLAEGAQKVLKAKEQWEKLAQAQENAAKATEEVANSTKGISSYLSNLRAGVTKLFSGFTKLYQNVKRIATRMLIRSALRGLISSIKEGITNLYSWSKATGGTFAKALDEAKSKVSLLKNSIGAALAPVIQSLIPLFNQLSDVIITAANWINQFFALITGQSSWTKAIQGTEALTEATTGAAKANKELLASFDELNVIQSEGGGGGGASAQTVDTGLFEQMYQFNEDVQQFVGFVEDNFDTILKAAEAVGAAILLWDVSEKFSGMLSTLSGILAVAAVGAVTITLTWLFTNEYLNTGDSGWLIADALTTGLGATAAGVLAKQIAGGEAGVWVAAITLTISAVTGIAAVLGDSDVSAFSKESITTLIENALKAGAAVGLLLGTVGGASVLTAVAGAGAAAVAVFAVSIGLKAALDPEVELFSAENIVTTISSAVLTGFAATLFTGSLVAGAVTAAVVFGALVGIKLWTSEDDVETPTQKAVKKSILAAVAAGLATLLFTGSVIPAGIVAIATFGVVAAIEVNTDKEYITWGDINLTDEEVTKFVKKKMFTVEPDIMLKLTKDSISDVTVDEENIQRTLAELIPEMKVVKLGLADDQDYADLQEKITGKGGLIDQVNEWINSAENLNKLALTFTPKLFGETEGGQTDWFAQDADAWDTIKEYMKNKGDELAAAIADGEKEGLQDRRSERVAAILEELTTISNILAGSDTATEAQIDLNIKLKDLDSSSFEKVMKEYSGYKEQIETAAEEIQKTAEANKIRQIEALKKLIEIDPENEELKETLAEAETGLQQIRDNWTEAVNSAVDEMTAPGRDMLKEWIENNIGKGTIDFDLSDKISDMIQWGNVLGGIEEIFSDAGMDMDVIDINELLEVGGWDLLSSGLQKQIIAAMGGVLNDTTIQTLKDKLKLSADQIIGVSGFDKLTETERTQLVTSLNNAFGAKDTIDALKKAIPNISADGIVKMTDWDKMTKNEQSAFVKEMQNVFGNEETKKAMQQLGVDVSKDIQTGIDSTDPTVKVGAEWEDAKDPKTIFEKAAENLKAKAKIAAQFTWAKKKDMKTVVNEAKDKINKKPPVISGKYDYLKGSKPEDIKNEYEKMTPKVTVSATVDGGAAAKVGKAFADGVSDQLNKKKFQVKFEGDTATIEAKANGGLVRSGDIFMANENGKSEMIGRFGNSAAVANQDQMVEAMARGVSYAQAEQNSLLREQNRLLLGILQKEGTVNIGASSALGRTVRQSLNMYDSLVGG